MAKKIPPKVREARLKGDKEKLKELGRRGGLNAAKRKANQKAEEERLRKLREKEAAALARARGDDLLDDP